MKDNRGVFDDSRIRCCEANCLQPLNIFQKKKRKIVKYSKIVYFIKITNLCHFLFHASETHLTKVRCGSCLENNVCCMYLFRHRHTLLKLSFSFFCTTTISHSIQVAGDVSSSVSRAQTTRELLVSTVSLDNRRE